MRQETTNTFDKGLNKDLNPIVTPNDVLTDCLNGTFITFNGDELSLQNDAGNTKITVPWDKRMLLEYTEGASYNSGVVVEIDKIMYRSLIDANTKPIFNEDNSLNEVYWELFDPSVKLSDGFYPIGIKEYGGVLYIVSGKKGERNAKGKYVNPLYDYDKVEFGSYPAPIQSKGGLVSGDTIKIDSWEEEEHNLLYETIVLNDTSFKTGGYAIFDGLLDFDVENLQIPADSEGLGAKDGFYKVRLLHQLNNGSFDLTEDVWKRFREHQRDTGTIKTHWIDSVDGSIIFKYLCPNQYKGKLVIIVEIDEPPLFEFETLPTAEMQSENYEINLSQLKWESSNTIDIVDFVWKLIFTDGTVRTPENGGTDPFSIEKKNNLVSYEVWPKTNYVWDDFPKVFRDKYVLRGTVLLAEKYYSMYFERLEGVCILGETKKKYQLLVLSNSSGRVGLDLENIRDGEKSLAFVLQDSDIYGLNENYLVLGNYIPENNKAKLEELNEGYVNIIKEQPEGVQLLESILKIAGETEVISEDYSCGNFTITVKFNHSFNTNFGQVEEEKLIFYYINQEGVHINIPYTTVDGRSFNLTVNTLYDLHIRVKEELTERIKILRDDFEADRTYNIALVTSIHNVYYDYKNEEDWLPPNPSIFKTSKLSSSNRNLVLETSNKISLVTAGVGANGQLTTISNLIFSYWSQGDEDLYYTIEVTNPAVFTSASNGEASVVGPRVSKGEYYNLTNTEYVKHEVSGEGAIILDATQYILAYGKPA